MYYHFKAKSLSGETKEGFKEVKDEKELAKALREEGFVLSFFEAPESESKKKSKYVNWLAIFQRVSIFDKLMFTQNLGVMVAAGLPLAKSLEILANQTKNPTFKKNLLQIMLDVSSGQTLSFALSRHPRVFSELFVNMIAASETAGNMEEVLKILGKQIKADHELISRVRGAMIYPAIVITVMIIVGIVMMTTIVPTLAGFFIEMNLELPTSTKIIIALSGFLKNYWYLLIFILTLAIYLFKIFLKTKIGKIFFDFLIINFPFLKSLSRKINTARFARTLNSLISSGIPITRALNVTAKTLANHYYSDVLFAAAKEIEKGKNLSQSIEKYEKIYPPIVSQMIKVGEDTGKLSEILDRLASFYEEDVSETTKQMSTIIEPILMIVIGIAVGFFAVSMIQPMYMIIGSQ